MSGLGIVRRSRENLIRPSSRAHPSLKPVHDAGPSFRGETEDPIFTDMASSADGFGIGIGGRK